MRLLSRLLVILVLCLVTIALPAAPVQADGGTPYITLSPPSGVPGREVTVHGSNFTANEWFDIYYYRNTARVLVLEVKSNGYGYFEDSFTIPESYAGDHEVRAYMNATPTKATKDFTVKPGLTVSPKKGPVGTNVTVEGLGFAKDEAGIEMRYYLDGAYATIATDIKADGYGTWNYTFPVPSSDMGGHKIDAEGDDSSFYEVKDASFEVTPGLSLDELSGSPGENITMTGSGFVASGTHITILFAGQEVATDITANDKGYWQGKFEVPEMPKGTYDVTAEGQLTPQTAITALSFAIVPGIVLSPDEGHVGMNLTVAGGGFPAHKDVSITYEGSPEGTATTNAKGSFDNISFPVPESQHGARRVTAQDAAGNNATAIFTMESIPPGTPALGSPSEGSRVGFIGKVRPTFNWSAVSDESGVYYTLQIATSDNVTAAGFANFTLSVPGIAATNYTLNATQALPYGTYYWIVQAVDGAENAGNWTAAGSFQAGLLPLWAFIVIIIAIVAGIGTAVYYFVIRKRIYYY